MMAFGSLAPQGTGESQYRQFIRKYRGFPSLYVRGTNNSWGLTSMTRAGTVWSATGVVFANLPNQAFKFDVYGDWTLNFGGAGSSGNAYQNGLNISVNSGATYNITFDETSCVYTATLASAP